MTYILVAILAMGPVTLLCRAAAFLFFRDRKPPEFVDYPQLFLPPVVMPLLVLNGLKGVRFDRAPFGLPELAATGLTALLHAWKRAVLLSIVAGTALYMILIRIT